MAKLQRIKQEQLNLWHSLTPQLQKTVQQLLNQLRQKSIKTVPPDDLEFRKNKLKFMLEQFTEQDKNFDFEEHYQIIAFIIEQSNVSLLELSDHFVRNFGKTTEYWTLKITQWATLYTFYTGNLVIWNVNSCLRSYLDYPESPIRRDDIYQWRARVQSYLSSLNTIIKKIRNLKKTDQPYIMDQPYFKYQKQKVLFTTFLKKFGFTNSNQSNGYQEQVTVTYQNKQKAQKKLFNFPHATRTIDDMNSRGMKNSRSKIPTKKNVNTLQKYNFMRKKNSQSLKSQSQAADLEEERQNQYQIFLEIMQNIGKKQYDSIQSLRQKSKTIKIHQIQQIKRQKQILVNDTVMKTSKKSSLSNKLQQNSTIEQLKSFEQNQYQKYSVSHYLYLSNPDDFFSFEGYAMANRKQIQISHPFIMYPWVNYYINDKEEFQELMAVSLDGQTLSDDQTQMSDFEDDSDSNGSFIDRREGFACQEGRQGEIAPQDKINWHDPDKRNCTNKWSAHYKNIQDDLTMLYEFQMIPTYGDGQQLPYTMEGTDDPRTKRRPWSLKSKQISNTSTQNNVEQNTIKYRIQQIQQNFQQDNDTTNIAQKQKNEDNTITMNIPKMQIQQQEHAQSNSLGIYFQNQEQQEIPKMQIQCQCHNKQKSKQISNEERYIPPKMQIESGNLSTNNKKNEDIQMDKIQSNPFQQQETAFQIQLNQTQQIRYLGPLKSQETDFIKKNQSRRKRSSICNFGDIIQQSFNPVSQKTQGQSQLSQNPTDQSQKDEKYIQLKSNQKQKSNKKGRKSTQPVKSQNRRSQFLDKTKNQSQSPNQQTNSNVSRNLRSRRSHRTNQDIEI